MPGCACANLVINGNAHSSFSLKVSQLIPGILIEHTSDHDFRHRSLPHIITLAPVFLGLTQLVMKGYYFISVIIIIHN